MAARQPTTGRPRGHGFAPDGPIGLPQAGEHEDVGRPVQGGHAFRGQGTVDDHPPGQVRPGQPGSHTGAVAGIGAVVPGQVQGGQPGRVQFLRASPDGKWLTAVPVFGTKLVLFG